MNVKIIRTGEIREVNDSYGARLIEQGKAAICPREPEEKTAAPKKGGRKNGTG